jgi:hypothetical protein
VSSISVILNLSPQALSAGRLAGRAEIVATGEQQLVRSAAELVAFLAERSGGEHKGADDDGER